MKLKKTVKKHKRIVNIIPYLIVSLFIFIIVVGALKYFSDGPNRRATENQIANAKSIISIDLLSNSDDISNYRFIAEDKIRRIKEDGKKINAIEACLISNSTKQIYLIDTHSGKILVHTRTTFYESGLFKEPYDDDLTHCRD